MQLDDDAAAGELGVAQLTYRGGDELYEAEAVVTVTAGGGTASGDDDGEDLPDTGTSSTTVALAALGLLLAGAAAMTLRARRARQTNVRRSGLSPERPERRTSAVAWDSVGAAGTHA